MARTRLVLILCAAIGLGLTLTAQEKITLTVAESNGEYRIGTLVFVMDDPATSVNESAIILDLKGQNGENVSCRYSSGTTPTAQTLITAMNKRDFSTAYNNNASTGSLRQTIYHRLFAAGLNEGPIACGKTLTGTLSGVVP